jgi:hypothetical protein
MDVIAASNNHKSGPQTGVSLTYGGLSAPYKRGLHERINPVLWRKRHRGPKVIVNRRGV